MQLTVVSKRDGEWRAEALMNTRHVTFERQLFLDDVDSLPSNAQAEINDGIVSLKRRYA